MGGMALKYGETIRRMMAEWAKPVWGGKRRRHIKGSLINRLPPLLGIASRTHLGIPPALRLTLPRLQVTRGSNVWRDENQGEKEKEKTRGFSLTSRKSSNVFWSTPLSSKSTWEFSQTSLITFSNTAPCPDKQSTSRCNRGAVVDDHQCFCAARHCSDQAGDCHVVTKGVGRMSRGSLTTC